MTSSLKKARKASRYHSIHQMRSAPHRPTRYKRKPRIGVISGGSQNDVSNAIIKKMKEQREEIENHSRFRNAINAIIEFIKGVFRQPVTA